MHKEILGFCIQTHGTQFFFLFFVFSAREEKNYSFLCEIAVFAKIDFFVTFFRALESRNLIFFSIFFLPKRFFFQKFFSNFFLQKRFFF